MTQTPPRLISVYFDLPPDFLWSRLARVLMFTAARQCPTWSREIRPFVPAEHERWPLGDGYWSNTVKLDEWEAVVATAPAGDRILLLDTDTMVTRSLDAVWGRDFDIAITRRPKEATFPYNAGVIFLRVNPRSRAFMRAWRDRNRAMLADPPQHAKWRKLYGGMNQAALGCLLEEGGQTAQVLELPCAEWNCEDASWLHFSEATRIVHVKSGLRRAIFHRSPGYPAIIPLVRLWRRTERAALEAEPAPPPKTFTTDDLPKRPPGRPRGPETVVHSVRMRTDLYDAICRAALKNRESVATLIQRVLDVHLASKV